MSKEELKQNKALEQMALDDQKTINSYMSMEPAKLSFHYSTRKSMVRNYRDFEIYRSMKVDEANSYGKYQKNADFINLYTQKYGEKLMSGTTAEDNLSINKLVLHLCESSLIADSVSVEDLKDLTEHLMAGVHQTGVENNLDVLSEMKEDGKAALGEIYFRQLEALNKKYAGDKLMKMSPSAYLKAMPQIAQDFACIEDMDKFFSINGSMIDDNAYMKETLRFYADSWKGLQDRYNNYLNGNFDGNADKAFKTDMKRVYNRAKEQKIFKDEHKRAKRNIKEFWKTKEKQKLKVDKAFCDKEDYLDKEDKKMQEVLDAANKFVEDVKDYEEKHDVEKISDKELEEIVEGIKKSAAYHIEKPTRENIFDIERDLFRRIENLCDKIATCGDNELIKDYTEIGVEHERIDAIVRSLLMSEFFVEVKKEDANSPILNVKSRLSRITKDYPMFGKIPRFAEDRMKLIRKYGYSNGVSLSDSTNMLGAMFESYEVNEKIKKEEEAKKVKYIPMGLMDAVNIDKFVNRFADISKLDIGVINKEIEACKTVLRFRETQPNFYYLGLTFEQLMRAEAMCNLLPYYEEALKCALQYIGIKKYERESARELKENWERAFHLYDINLFKVENTARTKAYKAKELDDVLDVQNEIMRNEKIWDKGTDSDTKDGVAQAYDFISKKSEEIQKEDISGVISVEKYRQQIKADSKKTDISDEQFDNLSVMAFQFTTLLENIEQDLSATNYADYKFFERRMDIYSAMRMSQYLELIFRNEYVLDELKGKCADIGHLELLKEVFQYVPKALEKISVFNDYTTAINIDYALRNDISMKSGKGYMRANMKGQLLTVTKDDAGGLIKYGKEEVGRVIEQYAIDKQKEANKEEIRRQQLEARLRRAVGQEKIASDSKVFMANLKMTKDMQSFGGNLVGAPLQLFSWVMHEARTEHGMVHYDKCKEKYNEMMENLGENHAMRNASLPVWQRGDADCAPTIDLDNLFGSKLKKRIYGALNYEENVALLENSVDDIKYMEFKDALEAIKMYSTVVGIVNTDTTEMEMAFLDKFMKTAQDYIDTNFASDEDVIKKRCNLLRIIMADLNSNLTGTLASTMSEEELQKIDENTIAYVEDTIYSKNMDESNIKDIPLFLHEPNINDVKQSSIGDCWLVSAISAVVRSSPDFIKSMFHDTGDGNVIVRLYSIEKDGKNIFVDKYNRNDTSMNFKVEYFKLRKHYETGWGNASDCTWVQLLEKAYALSGYNGRKEMEVKGDKLYNVVDELTYGMHDVAMMHITGKRPESVLMGMDPKTDSRYMKSIEFLTNLTRGLPLDMAFPMCMVLESGINEIVQGKSLIGMCEEVVKDAVHDNINDPLYAQCMNQLLNNIANMSKGLLSEPEEELVNRLKEMNMQEYMYPGYTAVNDEAKALAMKVFMEYVNRPKNKNYNTEENLFYMRCKEAFESGTTLSVAIPHCVDLLDAKEHEGRFFILMRDPFNIYNYEYTRENGEINSSNEGFGTVLTGHKENRYLSDNEDDIIHYGFRGTSWVELKDLYERVYAVYKAPVNLQPEKFD